MKFDPIYVHLAGHALSVLGNVFTVIGIFVAAVLYGYCFREVPLPENTVMAMVLITVAIGSPFLFGAVSHADEAVRYFKKL